MTRPTAEPGPTVSLVTGANRGIGHRSAACWPPTGTPWSSPHAPWRTRRRRRSSWAGTAPSSTRCGWTSATRTASRPPHGTWPSGSGGWTYSSTTRRSPTTHGSAPRPPTSVSSRRPPRPTSTAPGAPCRPSSPAAAQRPRQNRQRQQRSGLAGRHGERHPRLHRHQDRPERLTRMLADELRGDRILVNAVCPAGSPPTWAAPAAGPSGRAPPVWCRAAELPTTAPPAASTATAGPFPGDPSHRYRPDGVRRHTVGSVAGGSLLQAVETHRRVRLEADAGIHGRPRRRRVQRGAGQAGGPGALVQGLPGHRFPVAPCAATRGPVATSTRRTAGRPASTVAAHVTGTPSRSPR